MSGISISGLEQPLIIRHSVNISCMTDLPVTSIEWRYQSSQLSAISSDAVDLTVLEYTIPHVTEDLRGQMFTCAVVAGDKTFYDKGVIIKIEGS